MWLLDDLFVRWRVDSWILLVLIIIEIHSVLLLLHVVLEVYLIGLKYKSIISKILGILWYVTSLILVVRIIIIKLLLSIHIGRYGDRSCFKVPFRKTLRLIGTRPHLVRIVKSRPKNPLRRLLLAGQVQIVAVI